ncbi:Uncharacterised protein [uncultured archaeon]|nr:Uncharacterised protein [uncultured archaeon]
MNQKAFAIFVGAIMILSAFAGFVLRGSDQNVTVVGSDATSLQVFGVQGNLVDWDFGNLADTLQMAPESTVMAYWLNLDASQNLTAAAAAALPQSLGMTYGSQLYSTKIERLAKVYFNNTWLEFHWIKPFALGYSGLVVPYENYMMIPTGTDYVTVMGKPTLFGTQDATRQVIDVIAGGLPTDNFTLALGESADLQVAALGRGGSSMPLSGNYKEFYLGVSTSNDTVLGGFNFTATYLQPAAVVSQTVKELADKNALTYTSEGSDVVVSGHLTEENLQGVLVALLKP